MSSIIGRRLPDTPEGSFPLLYDELQPGDAWKSVDAETRQPIAVNYPSNLTGCMWVVVVPMPDGKPRIAVLTLHTVREHEDGTISVRPGDGSSNSILVTGRAPGEQWHGYVEHNVWTAC